MGRRSFQGREVEDLGPSDARGSPTRRRPLLVAHRGGAGLVGGDVVAGVRWLVEHGADAAELDVRRTRDEVLVVHHDAHWRDMPLASTDYGDMARDEEPPRKLEDVLAATEGRLALDIELKEPGYEDDVVSLALTHVALERLVVTSFRDEAVLAVKSRTPAVRAGLLVGRSAAPRALLADALPFGRLRRCRADFLAPNVRLLVTGLRRRARNRGVPLLLWTLDDDERIRRYLEDPYLVGVVTDSPRALAEPFGEPAEGWPLEQAVAPKD